MSKFSHTTIPAWILAAATVLLLSACATTPSGSTETKAVETPVAEFEPWDGNGLDIPLDGSSMEAWETSMARVEAHSAENEYKLLQNAIDWLLVYDLPSKKDMNVLITRLDGKTGREVISQVRWIKPPPAKATAPADKTVDKADSVET